MTRPVPSTSPTPTSWTLTLPPAIVGLLDDRAEALPSVEARMELVISLARANVTAGGGPFAAAIFTLTAGTKPSGTLLGAGVNLVVPSCAPIAHAELVAIALTGQRLGTWDLGGAGPLELVTSCEPCAMCLGAVPWSGVRRVVAGARDVDARAVGFDEGDKPADWAQSMRRRGVEVLVDVGRTAAAEVLRRYAEGGGRIYNGAGGSGRA